MSEVEVQANLEPVWSTIRNIRSQLKDELSQYPAALRYAAAMVASELLENAIKYGEPVPTASQIAFSFSIENQKFRIAVSNGVRQGRNVHRLQEHIAALAAAKDRAALYIARLETLLEEPSQSTGLGIYRIGLEGGYDLECTYEDQVVTVIATRSCHDC